MQVEFLKKFSKDLDDLKVNSVKQSLGNVIQLMEAAERLEDLRNTKKLKNNKTAYRIRVEITGSAFSLKIPKLH
jgi:mRNA-degrading endonuclease RelE of RelBE toxin-antitoxin system